MNGEGMMILFRSSDRERKGEVIMHCYTCKKDYKDKCPLHGAGLRSVGKNLEEEIKNHHSNDVFLTLENGDQFQLELHDDHFTIMKMVNEDLEVHKQLKATTYIETVIYEEDPSGAEKIEGREEIYRSVMNPTELKIQLV